MTGLLKEIRILVWPASAVLAATTLPLLWVALAGVRGWPIQVALSAFILGSALLVALPFGAEFQQRTLGLVLSQPVARSRVWLEKWAALLAVLLVLGVVQFVVFPGEDADGRTGIRAISFLLALACSGFLWTLVAGSTIGGAAFTLAALAIVEMTSSVITSRLTGIELDPFAPHPALVTVRVAYALVTLWLGRRLFSRFQLEAQGHGPSLLPVAALDGIRALRCRPAGPIRNLVRKELRLHQPTVLIAALFTACWLAALLLFSMGSERPAAAELVFVTLVVSYVPLVLVVCGTISIGEDTSLGIRAWHLTLPVSSVRQWAVKVGVLLAAGTALGLALPLGLNAVTPLFIALPAGVIQLPSPGRIAAMACVLLVTSFWSSTLVGHTIRAAVATGVAVPALWICVVLGSLAGQRLEIGSGWMTSLMVANQWSPEDLVPIGSSSRRLAELFAWTSIAILALLALRQSLAAFRTPQTDRRRMARYGLQLALAAAVVSFVPNAYVKSAGDQYRSRPVRELQAALQHVSAASLAATGRIPAVLHATELDATGQLSADARRWLAGSRISLRTSASRPGATAPVRWVRTDVRFPNGSAFRMLYTVPPTR